MKPDRMVVMTLLAVVLTALLLPLIGCGKKEDDTPKDYYTGKVAGKKPTQAPAGGQ